MADWAHGASQRGQGCLIHGKDTAGRRQVLRQRLVVPPLTVGFRIPSLAPYSLPAADRLLAGFLTGSAQVSPSFRLRMARGPGLGFRFPLSKRRCFSATARHSERGWAGFRFGRKVGQLLVFAAKSARLRAAGECSDGS